MYQVPLPKWIGSRIGHPFDFGIQIALVLQDAPIVSNMVDTEDSALLDRIFPRNPVVLKRPPLPVARNRYPEFPQYGWRYIDLAHYGVIGKRPALIPVAQHH